jgi:molybdate transport system permease protein
VDFTPLALTLQVATTGTAIAVVIGIATAFLFATKKFPGRDLLDVILTAPMVLPPTVLGYYVLVALGRRSAIGQAFEALTGHSIVFTKTGAVVAATIGAFPLVVKSARAALEGVDQALLRAARTLGAGPGRTFFSVHLPLAARGIVAGAMLAFAKALGDFGVTLMVAGDIPGETQTASLWIYDALQARREQDALVMVIILSLVAMGLLYGVIKLGRGADAA